MSAVTDDDSFNSNISTEYMNLVLEKLKQAKNRDSTKAVYHNIWKNFNKFVFKLDKKPKAWEDRTALYCAFLADNGAQSSTIKTYVSAIKLVLKDDDYEWDDSKILLTSITRGCRVINDRLCYRRPIKVSLLEMLLFEVDRLWDGAQPYLQLMYKTLFAISYYGLMRVGEVTKSTHVLKAKDVFIGQNKDKILLLLHTSKTHARNSPPQEIKILANSLEKANKHRHFCPFKLANAYMQARGGYSSNEEQFFVFATGLPVQPTHARGVLKQLLVNLNYNAAAFNFHSLRIGHSTDLNRWGYPIEKIQQMGRWKSSAVYRYLKS